MEGRGGMEHGHNQASVDAMRLPVDAADAGVGDEFRHREASQGDNHFGVDGFNLAVEIGRAGGQFFRLGVAVARWTAFDHVGDEDILPLETDAGQQLLQKFTGGPHEGASLLVLVETGSFANQHDVGIGRPFAGNGVLAGVAQGAARTNGYLLGDLLQNFFRGHGTVSSGRIHRFFSANQRASASPAFTMVSVSEPAT